MSGVVGYFKTFRGSQLKGKKDYFVTGNLTALMWKYH